MSHDLKIKGARVLDGSGKNAFTADVAIKDGVIVEVGKVTGPAHREIDADGALLTPGFIDIHTHYDAQAMWDSTLESAVRHGVTTAVMGNCGVGFAPLKPETRHNIIDLMAGVEDIPPDVLNDGLDWNWRTFGEYLDRLAAVERPIDLAAQVPHDAVRLFVMGERAAKQEQATADDIAAMQAVLREGLLAGAIGFSFGRVFGHKMRSGGTTPSYFADHSELEALASVLKNLPYRVLQGVTDGRMHEGPDSFEPEFKVVERMLSAAGRPMSINLNQKSIPASQDDWLKTLALSDRMATEGKSLRFQVGVSGTGSMMGLTSSQDPLSPYPSYRAIAHLPLNERVTALKDPQLKARVLGEKPELRDGDHENIRRAYNVMAALGDNAPFLFLLGEKINLEPTQQESVAGIAAATGKSQLEVIYDFLHTRGGKALLMYKRFSYITGDLSAIYQMLMHPATVFGLADAGAHLGYVCENAFTTRALTFWPRDRVRGPHIELPKVVHMLTGKIAEHLGMNDRGKIAVGLKADINIIDYDRLSFDQPYAVRDLPAGGRRFLQESHGYLAVIAGGQTIVENDATTGMKPGKLFRARAA